MRSPPNAILLDPPDIDTYPFLPAPNEILPTNFLMQQKPKHKHRDTNISILPTEAFAKKMNPH